MALIYPNRTLYGFLMRGYPVDLSLVRYPACTQRALPEVGRLCPSQFLNPGFQIPDLLLDRSQDVESDASWRRRSAAVDSSSLATTPTA